MTDTNLPEGTGESTPLTVTEAESKISDLLTDPETDTVEEDQETEDQADADEPHCHPQPGGEPADVCRGR